jgi:hypothetical protein
LPLNYNKDSTILIKDNIDRLLSEGKKINIKNEGKIKYGKNLYSNI